MEEIHLHLTSPSEKDKPIFLVSTFYEFTILNASFMYPVEMNFCLYLKIWNQIPESRGDFPQKIMVKFHH